MNRGRALQCVGCGATREQDVKFIYDESAPEVTDEAQLRAAQAGPDWICETCGTSNPNQQKTCRQCGAARGASQSRAAGMVNTPVPPDLPAQLQSLSSPAAARKLPFKALGCVAALLGILVITVSGGLIFYLTRTHEARLSVTGLEWQRSIEVEELQTLTEQSWDDQVPPDARIISRRREFHHNDKVQVGTRPVEQQYTERVKVGTRKVKVGTKDLGNGYFQDVYKDEPVYENRTRTRTVQEPVYRDVPIYKDKVTYQVDRWRVTRTAQATGQDNAPAWPALTEGPRLRAGRRTARYIVRLRDQQSGKTYETQVDAALFLRLAPGSVCRAQINNLGSITFIEPLAGSF